MFKFYDDNEFENRNEDLIEEENETFICENNNLDVDFADALLFF